MSAINNVMKNNFRNLELDEFFGNIKRRRIWTCRCIKDANRDQNYLKCYSSGVGDRKERHWDKGLDNKIGTKVWFN